MSEATEPAHQEGQQVTIIEDPYEQGDVGRIARIAKVIHSGPRPRYVLADDDHGRSLGFFYSNEIAPCTPSPSSPGSPGASSSPDPSERPSESSPTNCSPGEHHHD